MLSRLRSRFVAARKDTRKRTTRQVSPCLEAAEPRLPMATRIWDGGGANVNWTTPTNWVGNVVPQAGDNLEFPAGAARLTNTNDFAAGTGFGSLTFSFGGSGYQIGGNRIQLTGSIADSSSSAVNTLSLPIALPAGFPQSQEWPRHAGASRRGGQ